MNKIDNLDIKFFEEFPFLMDIFISSFNRLEDSISLNFKNLETYITSFTAKNPDWEIKENTTDFSPFFLKYEKSKYLQKLENTFSFERFITIKEKNNIPNPKSLYVVFGFWYEENIEENKPFLYTGIYRDNAKNDSAILPFDFYENLELGSYKKVINHPFKNDNRESIEFFSFKFDEGEISQISQFFLKEVMQPYFDKLAKLTKL